MVLQSSVFSSHTAIYPFTALERSDIVYVPVGSADARLTTKTVLALGVPFKVIVPSFATDNVIPFFVSAEK